MRLLVVALGCGGGHDRDGDGWPLPRDCDDEDDVIHPGAADASGDGIDSDCDGFDGSPRGLGAFPSLVSPDPPRALQLGTDFQVFDITGDGADDILAGTQHHAFDSSEAGQAWLFDGRARAPLAHWVGGVGPQLLGQFVDVAVWDAERPPYLAMRSLEGVWLVASTAESGYPGDVGGVLIGDSDPDDYLVGNRLRAVDLVGDASDDIVTECFLDDAPGGMAAFCVVTGPVEADTPVSEADVIVDGESLGDSFARIDAGGDGLSDLLVGAVGSADVGRVLLFSGPIPEGHHDDGLAERIWTGEGPDDWLGQRVFAGDLDGDGLEEVLANAFAWPEGERRGRLYVLDPDASTVGDASVVVDGDSGIRHLGQAAVVEDFDGDGTLDVAIGMPGLASLDADFTGAVLVFYGPVAGHLDTSDAGRVFKGEAPGDQAGWKLRSGDFDGDGMPDLAAAAPYTDGAKADTGAIYLLSGPILP